MKLRSLRPKQGASLAQLNDLLEGKGWKSAMPHALSDVMLLRLATDFRRVEVGFRPDTTPSEEARRSLGIAMYLIMKVLIDHPQRAGDRHHMDLSDDALIQSVKAYQIGLEREILTRITGFEPSVSEDEIADEMVRYANELHC